MAVLGTGSRGPGGGAGTPPPGTVMACMRGGIFTGVPSTPTPGYCDVVRTGLGAGGAGGGTCRAPLLTRVTTALGKAGLISPMWPPGRPLMIAVLLLTMVVLSMVIR